MLIAFTNVPSSKESGEERYPGCYQIKRSKDNSKFFILYQQWNRQDNHVQDMAKYSFQ